MTDERAEIARAACALDETLAPDSLDTAIALLRAVTPPTSPWTGHDIAYDSDLVTNVDDAIAKILNAVVSGGLARPSQDMAGVIRPLFWIDDTESKCTRAYAPALGGKMMVVELDPGSGEYSAGIDLSGLCFRFVLDTYHDGLGAFSAPAKFPSIEAAKSAAQADYEARVSSSLAATVGVEALVSFARPFADALDIECDFMTPPAPFEDGFDARTRARAALSAMDTPAQGGGDERPDAVSAHNPTTR